MGIDVAKLLITVGADVSGAEKGLKKVSSGLDEFGLKAMAVGKSLTAFATVPLIGLGTVAVMAASNMEESMNKVSVVFGNAGKTIQTFAQTAATQLGMSEQAALEATGTFGNLFITMGLGQQEAADMSMSIVTLASDLASFNNIDPGVALEKLRAGLVGEVEPLRALGVNVQESSVQLKAMEMGLAATTEELTNQDKVMARYALIMEQTGNAQGDFARTSDGLANQMRIAKAAVTDVAAAFGEIMIPYVKAAAASLLDLITKFQGMDESTKNLIVALGAITAALGPLSMAIGVVSKAASGLATVLGILGGPISLIIAGVGLLAGSIYMLVKANNELQDANKATARTAQESMNLMGKLAMSDEERAVAAHKEAVRVEMLGATYTSLAQVIRDEAIKSSEELAKAQKALAEQAEQTAMALVQVGLSGQLAGGLTTYTETIADLRGEYQGLWTEMQQAIIAGWDPTSNKVTELTDKMHANAGAQQDAAAAMREATTEMIFQQAAAGLDAQSTLTLARAMGVLSEQDYAVASTIQNLKTQFSGIDGVMDPTEAVLYAQAVQDVNTAIQNLALAGEPITIDNINEQIAGLDSEAAAAFDALAANANTSAAAVNDAFAANTTTMTTSAGTAADGIATAFSAKDWTVVGTGIDAGIADGIEKGIPAVEAAARAAAEAALEAAMEALGMKSPSKEFAWVGKQTMAGFAQGIRENMVMPVHAATVAASATTAGANLASHTDNTITYSPNVNVQASVASNIDVYELAQVIADTIRRERM